MEKWNIHVSRVLKHLLLTIRRFTMLKTANYKCYIMAAIHYHYNWLLNVVFPGLNFRPARNERLLLLDWTFVCKQSNSNDKYTILKIVKLSCYFCYNGETSTYFFTSKALSFVTCCCWSEVWIRQYLIIIAYPLIKAFCFNPAIRVKIFWVTHD